MRKLLLALGASAALLTAGCASSGYYGGGGYGYDYNSPGDVWYDGYYGPYTDGYWDDAGGFFYRDHDGRFQRDAGNHFRSRAFDGGQHFTAGHRHH